MAVIRLGLALLTNPPSGTYTTQAKGKRENRRSEILMREAEYAATMASLVDFNYEYPKKVSFNASNERHDEESPWLTICRNSTRLGKTSFCANSMTSCRAVVSLW